MFTGTSVTGSIILYRNDTVSNEFSSGRVVLYIGSRWGNICQRSSFTSNAADVICHQLTYTGASSWSNTLFDMYSLLFIELDLKVIYF